MSGRISTFRELQVYQLACELGERIFAETKRWPREEKFALIDQIRRSSRSIGANLSEARAKRRYPAHFLSKLTDADGELQETIHWFNRAATYGYLQTATKAGWEIICRNIGGKLGTMMQKLDSFC